MVLLSVNAGSSSLKVSVFDRSNLDVPVGSFAVETIETYEAAIAQVTQWLEQEIHVQANAIEAIGHRVVHGGDRYASAAQITPELLQYLESITPLAPNHMPATLTSLKAFLTAYPNAKQVACFDTSFFHNLPMVAQTLPLPLTLQRENSIRRYGFHGLSYEFLMHSLALHEGVDAANGRVILAHLGSGASITACKNGQPIDTSMGFTPVSGIMMSTRTGDIEPGVLTFLQKEKGMSADDISELVTHKSGLLGVSGTTADMYTLLQTQHENEDVALAIELFCYKIKKTIGSYIAALGGVDTIVFSGGIGERSAEMRTRICEGLEFAGVRIDEARNERGERLISSDDSQVGVHVIPTQEDFSIMTQTLRTIDEGNV